MARAFTVSLPSIVPVLLSPVGVSDPVTTRYAGKKMVLDKLEHKALWDTGATACAISSGLVSKLGLLPTGSANVDTGGGRFIQNTYVIDVWLPNGVIVPDIRATGSKIEGADLLIGMDIISKGDFAVTNYDKKTVFSFRMPSSKKIDFVAEIKTPAQSSKGPGRNQLCPCGSGKKFKYCDCEQFHPKTK